MYHVTFRWSADFLCMDKFTRGHRSRVPLSTHDDIGLVFGPIGELPQGHDEIISRSQTGEISSKQLKIADFGCFC